MLHIESLRACAVPSFAMVNETVVGTTRLLLNKRSAGDRPSPNETSLNCIPCCVASLRVCVRQLCFVATFTTHLYRLLLPFT